jgi:alkyl sulfatase BDS1-like metallo-beta-lactamase superfamily hydrolase
VSLDVDLTDTSTGYALTLRNGALTYTTAAQSTPADVVLHLSTAALPALLAPGGPTPEALAAAGVRMEGDLAALTRCWPPWTHPTRTSRSSPHSRLPNRQ